MPGNTPSDLNLDDVQDHSSKEINIRSFSWPSAGVCMLRCTWYLLLLCSTSSLHPHYKTFIQIVIVVVGFLITYKVFTIEDSDITKFARSLQNKLKGRLDGYSSDIEALGDLAGRILRDDLHI